jgi:hypothetical protein
MDDDDGDDDVGLGWVVFLLKNEDRCCHLFSDSDRIIVVFRRLDDEDNGVF